MSDLPPDNFELPDGQLTDDPCLVFEAWMTALVKLERILGWSPTPMDIQGKLRMDLWRPRSTSHEGPTTFSLDLTSLRQLRRLCAEYERFAKLVEDCASLTCFDPDGCASLSSVTCVPCRAADLLRHREPWPVGVRGDGSERPELVDFDLLEARNRAESAAAEAEWVARRCECGADDACAFARERDAAKADAALAKSLHDVAVRQRDAANWLVEQLTKERDDARSEASRLREKLDLALDVSASSRPWGYRCQVCGCHMAEVKVDGVTLPRVERCDGCEDVMVTHNIVQTERHCHLLEQENSRLREALRSCADIGEARVAKVVRAALTQDFEKPGDSVVTAGDLIGLRRA